jgi:hypothetical protein
LTHVKKVRFGTMCAARLDENHRQDIDVVGWLAPAARPLREARRRPLKRKERPEGRS